MPEVTEPAIKLEMLNAGEDLLPTGLPLMQGTHTQTGAFDFTYHCGISTKGTPTRVPAS